MEGDISVDPINIVLAALATGATAAAQETASQAVKDAYTGLKVLISKRFEKKSHAEMALAEYEKDADIWEKPLQKSLVETGVDQDEAVVQQAQHLLKLLHPQQDSQNRADVIIGKRSQGIVIGDHAQVTQTFNNAQERKR